MANERDYCQPSTVRKGKAIRARDVFKETKTQELVLRPRGLYGPYNYLQLLRQLISSRENSQREAVNPQESKESKAVPKGDVM